MKMTSNAIKYCFSDFTHLEYRSLLQQAKQQYQFKNYHSFSKTEDFIIWRHDVDGSLEAALDLAIIESELDISTTYFLLLHSDFYNLLDYGSREIVQEIMRLGHRIELHFDANYNEVTSLTELEYWLKIERDFLSSIFNIEIKAFSFHNPNGFALTCQNWEYLELINTYAKYFREQVSYCSDSNGYWRFEKIKNVIEINKNPQLQILTHPMWWTEKTMSPKEKVKKILKDNKSKVEIFYDNALKEYGRENIDW